MIGDESFLWFLKRNSLRRFPPLSSGKISSLSKMSLNKTTMASNAPKRGKFLTQQPPSPKEPGKKPVSSTNPTTPRGKSLGKTLTSPSTANTSAGSAAYAETDCSLSNLKTIVNKAKDAAVARRKEVSEKRDRVFNDLDQAENIILCLLDCASEVAQSLSEMTAAKASGNENAFEDLAGKIKENGVGYLAGVKKVHSLLAPHASLVKSYPNQDARAKDEEDNAQTKEEKSIADEIVKKATSNMYSARVEQRLALERSAILKEMIRLEELESATNAVDGNSEKESAGSAAAGSKRKLDSI